CSTSPARRASSATSWAPAPSVRSATPTRGPWRSCAAPSATCSSTSSAPGRRRRRSHRAPCPSARRTTGPWSPART
ncbi:MAG: hypothetical protein AVDCRST_MAG20-1239, partial [uncultured Acidimicrobiales bacterium]